MANSSVNSDRVLQLARTTLDIEAQALLQLKDKLTNDFFCVVEKMLQLKGHVVVMGMGKSGHVGRKIAATLSSTGTAAMFVHPAEASHGDLGMVTRDDMVLAISNSGESEELIALLPTLERLGVVWVTMTGNPTSSLAKYAKWVINSGVEKEACPLNLAPTTSTTAQIALGDALAVALLDARGFAAEDFAKSHPGGSLGRRLLTRVSDVMRVGDAIPCVLPSASLSELIQEMSHKEMGASAIVDAQGHVLGVFTDGDLRRQIEKGRALNTLVAKDVMSPNPQTIEQTLLATVAAQLMEDKKITSLLVVNENKILCGAINTNDLLRAKVI
ncbi:MAG: KpsF/GutQ family sugar-phosphate isomerase [Limnohabitans sp.]|nr:KpsF/GutQ family sugar-phosphate isomerase [Limnohabitans sp.]